MTTEAPAKEKKTVQVHLSADLHSDLKVIAEEQGKKMYRVINEAVAAYIKAYS